MVPSPGIQRPVRLVVVTAGVSLSVASGHCGDNNIVWVTAATIAGFEKFIAWARCQRAAGQYICFAVVPRGSDVAIGLFQIRSLEAGFGTCEWGFALASEYWGTGMFTDGAELALRFAFEVLGAHRLEARAAVLNTRGTGALRKVGAIQEGVLRRSFLRNGEYLDQGLWTITAEDWLESKAVWGSRLIH